MFFNSKKSCFILTTCLMVSCMCFNVYAMEADKTDKADSSTKKSYDLSQIQNKVCDAILKATANPSKESYSLVAATAKKAALYFDEAEDLENAMKYRVIAAKANVSAYPGDKVIKKRAVAVLLKAAKFWQNKDEVLSEIYMSQIEEGHLSLDMDD